MVAQADNQLTFAFAQSVGAARPALNMTDRFLPLWFRAFWAASFGRRFELEPDGQSRPVVPKRDFLRQYLEIGNGRISLT
jgi:hypothetical protein